MTSNSLNLPEIDQEQALNLAKFFIWSGRNMFLFGGIGIGKTQIATQAIQQCGFKVKYINLSVVERTDIQGYPNVFSADEEVVFKSPHFLPKLLPNFQPDSVLLFDEIDKVQPEVISPLLEILLFKTINGSPINAVSCILTGNLAANDRSYANQLSHALLDRGSKYLLSFNFERWVNWAKSNDIHDLILGFLRSDPSFACGKIDNNSYASPTPRSWTLASRALSRTKEFKMADIESVSQIISGFVGLEAGMRFQMWYEYYRKFEPYIHSLIERGQMSLNFDDLMPTEKMVFVISTCYHTKLKVLGELGNGIEDIKNIKSKFVYLERLCRFFDQCQVDKEMRVLGLHNSFDVDAVQRYKLYACKIFFDHFTKLSQGVSIKKNNRSGA